MEKKHNAWASYLLRVDLPSIVSRLGSDCYVRESVWRRLSNNSSLTTISMLKPSWSITTWACDFPLPGQFVLIPKKKLKLPFHVHECTWSVILACNIITFFWWLTAGTASSLWSATNITLSITRERTSYTQNPEIFFQHAAVDLKKRKKISARGPYFLDWYTITGNFFWMGIREWRMIILAT